MIFFGASDFAGASDFFSAKVLALVIYFFFSAATYHDGEAEMVLDPGVKRVPCWSS